MYEKYANPMLGLVSAHALLQRKAIDPALLAHVTANLEQMLGPIPDVIALKLTVNPNAEFTPVEYPPILRWSWELLLQRLVDRPDVIRRYSLAEQVSGFIVGRGVWMSWIADPHKDRFSSAAQRSLATWRRMLCARRGSRSNASMCCRDERRKRAAIKAPPPALESVASDLPNLKGIVQMFGLPRSVIEEAVGGAAFTAPTLTQPATGGTAMN